MAPSVLVRIDRVLGKTKALIEAAILTENADDAYEKFWKRMEMPFQRTAEEDSDAYRGFAFAYEEFRAERDTMPAVMLDLKDIGYRCPGVIETQYTAVENPRAWEGAYTSAFEQLHPNESERTEALAKIQKWEQETDWHQPGLLEDLGELEQLLSKARSFAQKRPKRKRNRASDKPRKPRPLTPRQLEVIQIVGECKGNLAAAADKLAPTARR